MRQIHVARRLMAVWRAGTGDRDPAVNPQAAMARTGSAENGVAILPEREQVAPIAGKNVREPATETRGGNLSYRATAGLTGPC